MKIIKEFPGIDLAIGVLSPTLTWVSPSTLADTQNNFIELSETACSQLATRNGLNKAKGADLLFTKNPIKWRAFQDILKHIDITDHQHYCYMSKDGSYIYSFLDEDMSTEVDAIFNVYANFETSTIPTIRYGGSTETAPVFVSFYSTEIENNHIELINIFDPEHKYLYAYAVLFSPEGRVVRIVKMFDNTLVGKKHLFTAENLDINNFTYELLDDTAAVHETQDEFRLSLKETIEVLRTIQRTKQVLPDAAEFEAQYLDWHGEVDEETVRLIDSIYDNLSLYYFYYDNTRTVINDVELLYDKLKTPKPHLYFLQNVKFDAFKKLLLNSIRVEYDYFMNCPDTSTYDYSYLIRLFKLYDELMTTTNFDAYQIPYYWTAPQSE